MKPFVLFACLFLFSSFPSYGQYYYLPAQPGNPGNLNNDQEQPKAWHDQQSTGWIGIQGPTANPTWSAIQTIPFNFNFNGVNQSHYKVSTSGVLTFDTTVTAVPPVGTANLPSNALPNKSICILGLLIAGSNDYIISKTFGSSPNRQHWVHFASASAMNENGWTYWSIVLEEGSNDIHIVDQRQSMTTNPSYTVGIQINPTTALNVGGTQNVHSLSTNDETPFDNHFYTFIYGTQPNRDIKGIELLGNPFKDKNDAPFKIKGLVQNFGKDTITSATLNYQIDNGTTVSTNIIGLNLTFSDTATITFHSNWSPTIAKPYQIKLWMTDLNQQPDENNVNDTINDQFLVLGETPDRVVLFEEVVGTWCGWCPRGIAAMNLLKDTVPDDVATVNISNGDPMTEIAYTYYMGHNPYFSGGIPYSVIDRAMKGNDVSTNGVPQSFLNDMNLRKQKTTPVDVLDTKFISYDWQTKDLTLQTEAVFRTSFSGEYNIALILTEDNVSSNTPGYEQYNVYSHMSQGITLDGLYRDWFQSPDPVPAADMVYYHVARAILPDFFGDTSVIPFQIQENQIYSKTFTHQLEPDESIMDMNAICIVTDRTTQEVMNANSVSLNQLISIDENYVNSLMNIKVAPNPVRDFATIILTLNEGMDISYNIVNAMGQEVLAREVGELYEGTTRLGLDVSQFAPGMYMLNINAKGYTLSKRIIVD